jgi:Ran GTPase-activating protein (RanGAP) involved in mRNA processing and transport
MQPLAELFRSNRTIEVLDVVNCGLLDEGTATLLQAFMGPGANKTLKHLYIGTNGITARSAPLLADYLAGDCALESLYLSCNRLADDGVATLAPGLAANRTLKRLSLASNRIGPKGAAALAAALAHHPTIELLDLGFTKATVAVGELGNSLGDEGARVMAEMLLRNTTLRVLDLLHNYISQVGVNYIRAALKVNRTLTALQLTQFGRVHNEPGKEEIRAALSRNRELLAPSEAARVAKLELPEHVSDVYSVYRTHL